MTRQSIIYFNVMLSFDGKQLKWNSGLFVSRAVVFFPFSDAAFEQVGQQLSFSMGEKDTFSSKL